MKSERNYITPQGLQKLKDELKKLLYEERPGIVKVVTWAASLGDRSENADYQYGKARLKEIDGRIHFLQKRLEIAHVVDVTNEKSETIQFGATVTITNEDGTVVYKIVGEDESDPKQGWISWVSPIAKSLLGKKQGDWVVVKRPKGEIEYEVVTIEYK